MTMLNRVTRIGQVAKRNNEDPSLRSGFRRAAQTPRNRLNFARGWLSGLVLRGLFHFANAIVVKAQTPTALCWANTAQTWGTDTRWEFPVSSFQTSAAKAGAFPTPMQA
jgi:hypothetical protein